MSHTASRHSLACVGIYYQLQPWLSIMLTLCHILHPVIHWPVLNYFINCNPGTSAYESALLHICCDLGTCAYHSPATSQHAKNSTSSASLPHFNCPPVSHVLLFGRMYMCCCYLTCSCTIAWSIYSTNHTQFHKCSEQSAQCTCSCTPSGSEAVRSALAASLARAQWMWTFNL
jgi:hypothetical protein